MNPLILIVALALVGGGISFWLGAKLGSAYEAASRQSDTHLIVYAEDEYEALCGFRCDLRHMTSLRARTTCPVCITINDEVLK